MFFLVFIQGFLSFFSPCVIPLIPIYIGYLAGNAKIEETDGTIKYNKKKVFIQTLSFVIGISFAFFILGMSFSALGVFFEKNKFIFTKIAGVIIIILGLFQLGIFNFSFLNREFKLHPKLKYSNMNPFVAFIMGFTFSFAWTPCIGPTLSSVLILASNASSRLQGNLLVAVYSLGFFIPFLILGLFTSQTLNFLKSKKKLINYTIKAAGILLIIIGAMTFLGLNNNFSSAQPKKQIESNESAKTPNNQDEEKNQGNQDNQDKVIKAIDFKLKDQYGKEHTLSEYKGKVVFINFWGTWCPPCRSELPNIEEIYKQYNENKNDVIILTITNPGGQEKSISGIKSFVKKNKFTFPVLFDETGDTFREYGISSFPTTYMIDKNGNVHGYVRGALNKEYMESIIIKTIKGEM